MKCQCERGGCYVHESHVDWKKMMIMSMRMILMYGNDVHEGNVDVINDDEQGYAILYAENVNHDVISDENIEIFYNRDDVDKGDDD